VLFIGCPVVLKFNDIPVQDSLKELVTETGSYVCQFIYICYLVGNSKELVF
jgi:hypothetical protein